jgi:hypothetical protein
MAEDLNRLHLRFMLDTNVIDDVERFPDSPMPRLRELDREGWIHLAVSDLVGTETMTAPEDEAERLFDATSDLPEYIGPWTIGHSRIGFMRIASEEDADRLTAVFAAIFPGKVFGENTHDDRDAMHVARAMREGMHGFITRDKKLLKADVRVRGLKRGFRIYDPDGALALVDRRLRNHRTDD